MSEMKEPLEDLGWNTEFQSAFDALEVEDVVPARIVRENRGQYIVCLLYTSDAADE